MVGGLTYELLILSEEATSLFIRRGVVLDWANPVASVRGSERWQLVRSGSSCTEYALDDNYIKQLVDSALASGVARLASRVWRPNVARRTTNV